MMLSVKKAQRLLKLSLFSSILLLVACGQKGPLYLEPAADANNPESVSEAKSAQ